MLVEVARGELVTLGHPFYRALPGPRQTVFCPCGDAARVLVMVPGQRLERCQACYRGLAPYLDRTCRLVFIGGPP